MDTEEHRVRVNNYLETIRNELDAPRILLFGSRARNDALKSSDYDFLIISTSFENVEFRERLGQLLDMQEEPINVDVIPLTPAEAEKRKNDLTIVGKAFEEGREVRSV